jgi:hypothetical protein
VPEQRILQSIVCDYFVMLAMDLNIFSKNTKISNLTKIRPVRAELFHAGGRTERQDDASNRFSQFFKRA